VLGHLGPQRSGDVLPKELPHFGNPRALGVVELVVHNGDTIGMSTRQCSESGTRTAPTRRLTRLSSGVMGTDVATVVAEVPNAGILRQHSGYASRESDQSPPDLIEVVTSSDATTDDHEGKLQHRQAAASEPRRRAQRARR
jgi:hypothetical protein